MSRPAWKMLPAVCVSRPATMRSKVVLPQPDGPRKQTNSPCSIVRSMSESAWKVPNDFRMPFRRRYSVMAAAAPAGPLPGRRASPREAATAGSVRASSLLFRLGLRVVALVPLVENALAAVGGRLEVHLHQ